MEKSEQINELATALSKFQGSVGAVTMNKEAKIMYEKNGKWIDKSYRYADLAAIFDTIRKPLSDNGLSITQLATSDVNDISIKTILLHSSGQFISESLKMRPADLKIQTIGSTITYCKRYSLSAILGISTEEDDDGSAGNGNDMDQRPPEDRRPQTTGRQATSPAPSRSSTPPARQPRPTSRQQRNGVLVQPATPPETQDDLPWPDDAPGDTGPQTAPPLPDQNRLVGEEELKILRGDVIKFQINHEAMYDYMEKEFKKRDPKILSVKEFMSLIKMIRTNSETINKGLGF